MVKEELDLEEEWKNLRGKLENRDDESELEEVIGGSMGDSGEAMSSEEFARFLQTPPETTAPVLDKVEDFSSVVEQTNIEQGVAEFQSQQQEESGDQKVDNEPKYIMGMENPYQTSQTNIDPPILRPIQSREFSAVPNTFRGNLPDFIPTLPEGVRRGQLLDASMSASGISAPSGSYPEMIDQDLEDKDERKYLGARG